jgi:hypothetical protein
VVSVYCTPGNTCVKISKAFEKALEASFNILSYLFPQKFHISTMPNYRITSCPYCSKTFKSAGPFDNHLRFFHTKHAVNFYNKRSSHRKRVRSPDGREQETSPCPELPSIDTSDLSDALSPDDDRASDPCSDVESDFEDVEEIHDSDSYATRRILYEGSGNSHGSFQNEEESVHNLVRSPWYPFRNASEFKLARFFVEANVPWERIESFMKASLAPPDVYFTSAFTLRALLNNMDDSLGPESWRQGEVILSGTKTPFYYRDPVDCIKYLIRQRAYRSDMVFSPERLYEGDERQYGELHTADWWWDTQVCLCLLVKNTQFLTKVRKHFRRVQQSCRSSVPRILHT